MNNEEKIQPSHKATAGKSKIAQQEEEILKFWQENKIFEKSLEKTKKGKPFIFYDGPPFATGTPHYGHLVASVIKDVIPRYQTMKGRYVERQWGWDTHGLPIENIVEKELGIKSKKEIEEIGIEKFNNLCREKIFTYVDVWNKFIPRFGRWVDMDNPYRTMDASYMESEWWAFKKLFDKNLIYKDYRSMHICPRCETTLAQSEVAEGYKDVKDIAVTAKFKLLPDQKFGENKEFVTGQSAYLLAWTTTPWTLPGNVALAINKDISYSAVRVDGVKELLILASDLLEKVMKDHKVELVHTLKGSGLLGLSYTPLFNNYAKDEKLENRENGWKIYEADFVTTESGTGVVHIAPAFGEDDMDLGKQNKLPFVQHVGMDGIIRSEIKELAGLSVKPKDDPQKTDVEVLKILAKRNLLFSKEKYEHSYPHCWRCETPLLNYATSSWFVSVTKIKKDLLKHAKDINWQPKHIKEGRWLDWLENARDWSISRQRFWANTIPVWECEKCGKRKVVGSVDDIKKYGIKSGNTYFVMRHGQADHNILGVLSGKADNDHHLTKLGKEQVVKTSQFLEKKKIDMIFASPFVRTKETVAIVAEELGISSELIMYDERLKELWTGEMEGKSVEVYRSFVGSQLGRFTNRPKGGETAYDIKRRVMDLLYEIERKYSGKNILIVTHETPAWLLLVGVQGVVPQEAVGLWKGDAEAIATGSVQEVEFAPLPHNKEYELDLHRPYIDEISFMCSCGAVMKRITDVLDTWFDSGSVPFSSYHYPFENKDKVESRIPADFIAEGLDQISKWFYYQHVFATGLFGKQVFNNVIVNGIVLAEDGKKMAKRLQNYPDPVMMVDKYGADAIRFYLLSSPVVRAENLSFSENGVDDIYKKLILKLGNIISFYELYNDDQKLKKTNSKNILDIWIVARLNELSDKVTKFLDEYELDKASRPFIDFVEDFSTWYIRRSRDRFKSEDAEGTGSIEDRNNALATTRFVLLEMAKLIAPFTPFLAENIYIKLKSEKDLESVHLCDWPKSEKVESEKLKVLEEMKEVRNIVSLALEKRMVAGIKVRQPLNSLKVKSEKLKDKEEYIKLIKDEVNVKEISFSENLEEEVELDTEITSELQKEGNARDLIRAIQILRKEKKLKPSDTIKLLIETDKIGKEFINSVLEEIKKPTNVSEVVFQENDGGEIKIGKMVFKLKI